MFTRGLGFYLYFHRFIVMMCHIILVHGPGGVTMHPLRTLREWYNIVDWTRLGIKMLTLDILGPTRHFGWFSRWPP